MRFNLNSSRNRFCSPKLSINSFSCEVKGISMSNTRTEIKKKHEENKIMFIRKKTKEKERDFSYVISSPQIMLKKKVNT